MLVNNAGIFEAAPIDAAAAEWTAQWERTMRVNLYAAAELCRLAVLHFRERGSGGRIVNVASRAAYRGDSPDHWHYSASKAGMVAMTKTIARAYAAEGIYAYTICPGFTVTGMVEDYVASRGGGSFLADIPLGRPATTGEIAEIARWLAVDAPASATGAVDRRQRRKLCPLTSPPRYGEGDRAKRGGGVGTDSGAAPPPSACGGGPPPRSGEDL